MIRFTYDGKEFEFRGEYREPLDGDRFLAGMDSSIVHQSGKWGGMGVRAIVYPVLVIHEFGGVKFVETGEDRFPLYGEWYIFVDICYGKIPTYCHSDIRHDRTILKRYSDNAQPNGYEE